MLWHGLSANFEIAGDGALALKENKKMTINHIF